MKILLVHNYYRSRHVGGEDVVFDAECKALRKQLGTDNVFVYSVSNDNLKVGHLAITIWGSKYHAKAIKGLIRQHDIQLVHIHNTFPILTPVIFKAIKQAGAKCIQTLHNYRRWCVRGSFYYPNEGDCFDCLSDRKQAIRKRCYRDSLGASWIAEKAHALYESRKDYDWIDAFFYLSQTQKKLLLQCGLPDRKLFYKPNWVKSPEATVNAGMRKGFIYVGRLESGKGVEPLLEAVKGTDIRLTVIGEGDLDIKKKDYPNVDFQGRCDHEIALKKIAKARFLVQPSTVNETFGLTMMEALAHGTPVIALNQGTRAEHIQDTKNGFLCELSTLEKTLKFSQALKPHQYAFMSEKASESSLTFTEEYLVKKQIELYQKVCLHQNIPSCL
jgi:glycosyltransferase involved in cell wall biosynthesis